MRRLLLLLPFALAVAGCGGVAAATRELGPTERRSFAPGPTRLQLHLDVGQATVVGTADPAVTRERRMTDDVRVTEEVRGDTLHVRAHCPDGVRHRGCRADYTLRVPRAFAVTASGDAADLRVRGLAGALDVRSDAGDVRVDGADGRAVLATDAGTVDATGLRGATVEASTQAGAVRLGFERVPALVRASSEAGDVDVTLPAGPVAYEVDASADVGAVDVEVPTGRGTGHRVEARTDVGRVRVHT